MPSNFLIRCLYPNYDFNELSAYFAAPLATKKKKSFITLSLGRDQEVFSAVWRHEGLHDPVVVKATEEEEERCRSFG